MLVSWVSRPMHRILCLSAISISVALAQPPTAPVSEEIAPGADNEAQAPRRGLRLAHLWAIAPLAIAWYLMGVSLVGFAAMYALPESAPVRLRVALA